MKRMLLSLSLTLMKRFQSEGRWYGRIFKRGSSVYVELMSLSDYDTLPAGSMGIGLEDLITTQQFLAWLAKDLGDLADRMHKEDVNVLPA